MDAALSSRDMSRRCVFGGLAAGLCSAAIPRPAWAAEPPSETAAVSAGADAFAHLTVPVFVDGRGPFRFVVDTGADRTVLSDTMAEALELPAAHAVQVEGVVRRIEAKTVRVREISYGVGRAEDCVFPVLPWGWLQADGFLGLDMIDHHRVTFDFRQHQLRIERPFSSWAFVRHGQNEDVISVGGYEGHLRSLNCRVDQVPTTVFVDTGASISIGNMALFEALCARDPNYGRKMQTVKISGVTGGMLVARVADFQRIKIHDLSFTKGTMAFADMHIFAHWGLSDRPAMLIGMNFLRQFNAVTIDYGRKALTFDLASTGWMVSEMARRFG